LKLANWRDRLLRQIRGTQNAGKKKELIKKLREAVSRRFDLIVREKKITYKRLRERLEDLKKRMEESQAELKELQKSKTKEKNIDNRVKDLLNPKGKS
jgi:hypothetical protein